jgi:UDP-2-acetamido-2,6-beta-L-arabino-hexul-4-ose reductase
MKILVTGSEGFIGKNLCLYLKNHGHYLFQYDLGSSEEDLIRGIKESDFIVHLAGVNRPKDVADFKTVNFGLTKKIVELMEKFDCQSPILLGSSTQAALDNPYGESKALAESVINNFGFAGHQTYVFRFANVFGKWCKPNYNSVVATFCYNIARGLPIEVNQEAPALDFVYIDDVCQSILSIIERRPNPTSHPLYVDPSYSAKPKELAEMIKAFKASRETLIYPLQEGLEKKLYATYLSYLPENNFAYPLVSHVDERGSFTEFLKTGHHGQISVNIIKPGMTKGNHYHMTKNEKYLVVCGTCEIKERKIDEERASSYVVSDQAFKAVDIIPGYAHSIKNIGDKDAVVIMWASEVYDPLNDDTYPCLVEIGEPK